MVLPISPYVSLFCSKSTATLLVLLSAVGRECFYVYVFTLVPFYSQRSSHVETPVATFLLTTFALQPSRHSLRRAFTQPLSLYTFHPNPGNDILPLNLEFNLCPASFACLSKQPCASPTRKDRRANLDA